MRLIIAPRSTAAPHRPAEWGRLRCETINPALFLGTTRVLAIRVAVAVRIASSAAATGGLSYPAVRAIPQRRAERCTGDNFMSCQRIGTFCLVVGALVLAG